MHYMKNNDKNKIDVNEKTNNIQKNRNKKIQEKISKKR